MDNSTANLKVVISAQDDASASLQQVAGEFDKIGIAALGAGTAILTGLGEAVSAAASQNDKIAAANVILGNLAGTSATTSGTLKETSTQLKNTGDAATAIHDKIAALNITIADDEAKITSAGGAHKLTTAQIDALQQKVSAAHDQIQKYNDQLTATKTVTDKVSDSSTKSYGGFQSLQTQLMGVADSMGKYGVDQGTAYENMVLLYQKTGDVTTATQEFKDALDLKAFEDSIGKTMSFSAALDQVNKIASGTVKGLQDLDITTKNTGANGTVALKDMENVIGGMGTDKLPALDQAWAVMKDSLDKVVIVIGNQLIPYLTNLMDKIQPYIDMATNWVKSHQEVVKVVALVAAGLGIMLVVIGAVLLAIGAVAGVMTLFATAAAGPVLAVIALLVAAFVGIGAGIYLFKNDWGTFWKAVQDTASAAWNWLNTNVIQPMEAEITKLINMVANSPVGKVGGAIGGAIGSAYNFVAGHLAAGGPANAGSTYLVGENGPELFTPGVSGTVTPNGAFGGGMAISVNINGGMITSDTAKQIGNLIVQQFKRTSRW